MSDITKTATISVLKYNANDKKIVHLKLADDIEYKINYSLNEVETDYLLIKNFKSIWPSHFVKSKIHIFVQVRYKGCHLISFILCN